MCRPPCLNPFNHLHPERLDLPCGCIDEVFRCGCHLPAHDDDCNGQPAVQLEESR